jgi:hypothetical protein
MRLSLLILLSLIPTLALAQQITPQVSPTEADVAVKTCIQHKHFSSDKIGPDHKIVYDEGWEHCAEMLDLKIKSDKAKEASDVALTKRVLEQLKSKQ